MKRFITLLFTLLAITLLAQPQESVISHKSLLTPSGSVINAGNIKPEGGPLLVVFWNVNSNECCKQMDVMVNARDEYLKDYKVKLVSIYVADASRWTTIRPLIAGKDWDVESYFDVNSELSRELCIPQLPYTILYDPHMKKVCSYIGFCSGAEDMLCEKVKHCLEEIR